MRFGIVLRLSYVWLPTCFTVSFGQFIGFNLLADVFKLIENSREVVGVVGVLNV